jgi:hypothetical protein
MSMIIVKHINESGLFDIRKLYDKYPSFLKPGSHVMCFVNRVFNEEKKNVIMPKKNIESEFVESGYFHCIDLRVITRDHGIAKGYYVEIIASNILVEEDGKKIIIPVFPNEILIDCEYDIENIIKDEIEILRSVGRSYEIIGILHNKGFVEIADDFREAMIRFEKSDYDGSIKFFRKVIEGFKQFSIKNVIGTENKTKVIEDLLGKIFHLMSNFGEHTGTRGFLEEAIVSKDITMAIPEYIAKKYNGNKS